MEDKKLARASQNWTSVQPNIVPGFPEDPINTKVLPYKESIKACRFFYRKDPIASTVINRLADITATKIVNNRVSGGTEQNIPEDIFEVYNIVASKIQPYVAGIILSYLIDGMAIPQYELVRSMGNRLSTKLGRTRYVLPDGVWLRSAEHIQLQSTFLGGIPRAYLKIPSEDVMFIQQKGVYANGIVDKEAYTEMVAKFPEYVKLIESGQTTIPFSGYIIFRNLLPGNTYPIPYLEAALEPLQYKRYLKQMDKALASRAIEAFRHIKVGSDEYPADDEDIEATRNALNQQSSTERVYNLFTNHTIAIDWIVPPMDALLNDAKYKEANADIFFALGFPRILTVGETEKSNAADNKIASLGIISTILSIQSDIIEWLKVLYRNVAIENGFTKYPEPSFLPVQLADISQLIQYARDFVDGSIISRDTVASFYGTNWDYEMKKIEYEQKELGAQTQETETTNDRTEEILD